MKSGNEDVDEFPAVFPNNQQRSINQISHKQYHCFTADEK